MERRIEMATANTSHSLHRPPTPHLPRTPNTMSRRRDERADRKSKTPRSVELRSGFTFCSISVRCSEPPHLKVSYPYPRGGEGVESRRGRCTPISWEGRGRGLDSGMGWVLSVFGGVVKGVVRCV